MHYFDINKNDVLKICSNEEKVLENFVSLLSNKVFILNSKIKSISFKSIRQKVINYILNEVKEQKSSSIILKNTKEEIAALLGVPRPSLSRELINLRDMNYIEFNRKVRKERMEENTKKDFTLVKNEHSEIIIIENYNKR